MICDSYDGLIAMGSTTTYRYDNLIFGGFPTSQIAIP